MEYINIGEIPVYCTGDFIIEIKNNIKRKRYIKYNKLKKIVESTICDIEDRIIIGPELLRNTKQQTKKPNIKKGCNIYSHLTFKNGCLYAVVKTVKSDNNIIYHRYKDGMPISFVLTVNRDNNTFDIAPSEITRKKSRKRITRLIEKAGHPTIILRDNNSDRLNMKVLVKVGSIYEKKDKNIGITHFLEHMLFNNAVTHKNFKTVTTATEAFNAFYVYANATTDFYTTEYEISIPDIFINDVVPIFFDMISNFNIPDEKYFDIEKKIILEESIASKRNKIIRTAISTAIDDKDEHNIIEIIGNKNDIDKITLQSLEEWWDKWYINSNITITISGNLDKYKHDIIKVIYKKFKKRNKYNIDPEIIPPISKNDTKEAHITSTDLVSGTTSIVSFVHPVFDINFTNIRGRYKIDMKEWLFYFMIDHMYSGSTSSILHKIIRDKYGLSYAVNSNYIIMDSVLIMYAIITTSIDNKNIVIEKMREIANNLISNGITKDEFNKLKEELLINEQYTGYSYIDRLSDMYDCHGIVDQLNNNITKMLKEVTYKEFNNFIKNSTLFKDYHIFSISNEDNITK